MIGRIGRRGRLTIETFAKNAPADVDASHLDGLARSIAGRAALLAQLCDGPSALVVLNGGAEKLRRLSGDLSALAAKVAEHATRQNERRQETAALLNKREKLKGQISAREKEISQLRAGNSDAHIEHELRPILGALLSVVIEDETADRAIAGDLPPGAVAKDFSGLVIAYPKVEPKVDYIADLIGEQNHFPLKSVQLSLLACLNRPRGVMIDVGGNVGLTAIPPVKFGLVDEVVILEPSPDNCACLKWSIAANRLGDRVELHNVAAGDQVGTASMAFTRSSSQHHLAGNYADDVVSVATVNSVTLDSLTSISKFAARPWSFVKIDTQGAEVKILRGARNALAARTAMFEIEFWPQGIEALGDDPREALEAVETHFRWVLDGKMPGKGLRPISEIREIAARLGPGRHTDFILIP